MLLSWLSSQFFTGHGNFMSHLFRIGKSEDDLCPECHIRDDPIHRFLECALFINERRLVIEHLGVDTH